MRLVIADIGGELSGEKTGGRFCIRRGRAESLFLASVGDSGCEETTGLTDILYSIDR